MISKATEAKEKVEAAQRQQSSTPSKGAGDAAAATGDDTSMGDATALRQKIKRLEILLSKCKDTIRSNKERTQLLTTDKENLHKQLEDKSQEMEKYKVGLINNLLMYPALKTYFSVF